MEAVTDIFFSPHNDDETLFGAYTLLHYSPLVVVCFKSKVQERYGITAETREMETHKALQVLGIPQWKQWNILDAGDPAAYERLLDNMESADIAYQPQRVWAPLYELNGHAQHNEVARAATEVFEHRVQFYCTYIRGEWGRTRGVEVKAEAVWVARKMRALACYESQIEDGPHGCAFWFRDDTLREYIP